MNFNFNDFKLYLIIVAAGFTLWLAEKVYEYKIYKSYLNDFEKNQKNIKKSKSLTFDQQLELAMERQKKLQIESKTNKANKYTKEELKEKLAICNYFTDLYLNNRTKENEIRYVKACDPMYN